MNPEGVREQLDRAFLFYDHEAETFKDTTHAVLKFSGFYGELPREDRAIADQIMVEWALADDEKRRFHALSVIQDYSITAALPALRELADRFEHSDHWSAPSDWTKVNRLIGHLVEGKAEPGGEPRRA